MKKPKGPLLNIILDGYGIGKKDDGDGVFLAKTPVMDDLLKNCPHTSLFTHGHHVGLPGEDDMGGSEVGHLTIGAGKVIKQGSALIRNLINDGTFFEQPVLKKAMEQAGKGTLHLLGLLSDGNIHSHMDHWYAVIRMAHSSGVKKCFFHVLLDGRDVGVQSGDQFCADLEKTVKEITGGGPEFDYRIVSVGGREFMTMDRAKNWEKVRIGWNAHVHGKADFYFPDVYAGIEFFRKKHPGIIDQDIPGFVVGTQNQAHRIQDGDAVIMMNFRGDRAIEISQAFTLTDFGFFDRGKVPDVFYCGMSVYDEDTNLPENRIIEGASVENPFGKRILKLGLRQFRLAETQKYPHVTFFFNGGYRLPLDDSMEEYFVIDSDVIPSFSEKPAMKAFEIADKAVEFIRSGKFNFGLINFANPDMVGHTGDLPAVITAVECVDKALGKILAALKEAGGIALVTADHGNADEMLITNKKTGKKEISTKHSINPVPLVIYNPAGDESFRLRKNTPEQPLSLSMIAATNFQLLGLEIPNDLDSSLII